MYLTLPGPGGGFEVNPPDGFEVGGTTTPSLGDIMAALLPYIMAIAGMGLFVMLIAGGFTLLTGASNPESVKKGQQLIVSAVIGFVIIFIAFWLMQMLEYMLGLQLGFSNAGS